MDMINTHLHLPSSGVQRHWGESAFAPAISDTTAPLTRTSGIKLIFFTFAANADDTKAPQSNARSICLVRQMQRSIANEGESCLFYNSLRHAWKRHWQALLASVVPRVQKFPSRQTAQPVKIFVQ